MRCGAGEFREEEVNPEHEMTLAEALELLHIAPQGWTPAGWWADLDPEASIPFEVVR